MPPPPPQREEEPDASGAPDADTRSAPSFKLPPSHPAAGTTAETRATKEDNPARHYLIRKSIDTLQEAEGLIEKPTDEGTGLPPLIAVEFVACMVSVGIKLAVPIGHRHPSRGRRP